MLSARMAGSKALPCEKAPSQHSDEFPTGVTGWLSPHRCAQSDDTGGVVIPGRLPRRRDHAVYVCRRGRDIVSVNRFASAAQNEVLSVNMLHCLTALQH